MFRETQFENNQILSFELTKTIKNHITRTFFNDNCLINKLSNQNYFKNNLKYPELVNLISNSFIKSFEKHSTELKFKKFLITKFYDFYLLLLDSELKTPDLFQEYILYQMIISSKDTILEPISNFNLRELKNLLTKTETNHILEEMEYSETNIQKQNFNLILNAKLEDLKFIVQNKINNQVLTFSSLFKKDMDCIDCFIFWDLDCLLFNEPDFIIKIKQNYKEYIFIEYDFNEILFKYL